MGHGHAAGWVGGLLAVGYMVRLTALEVIVLFSPDPDQRDRALMLRFPRLAKLLYRPPPPAGRAQANTPTPATDKTVGFAELPSANAPFDQGKQRLPRLSGHRWSRRFRKRETAGP